MAAPTYPATQNLAEGTGNRSLPAVTTTAGDYLVIEVIGEDAALANVTPSHASLTFTKQNDIGTASHTRVQHWTAPDAAGGSRTILMTASVSGRNYRAQVTVVRGSAGPGTGKATSGTTQTVSVTRQGANSGMFYAIGDWNTGAVGTPVWTPGGSTTLSQQGSAATYIFGRWDDSGATATASHGISSPTYTTPSIAVLEMLGTAGGTTTPVSLAGGITPAGALTRQDGKQAAGGLTPAGAVAKQTGRRLTGGVTPAGNMLRSTGKVLAGALTPAGTLAVIKAALRTLTGGLTPVGAVTRRPGKSIAGGIAPAGALTQTVGKALTGSITPTGALSTIKAVLRAYTGGLTPAGQLQCQVGKAVAGSLGSAGLLRRTLARTVVGTLATAGSLAKQTAKRYAGGLTPAGAVAVEAADPGDNVVHRPFTGTAARPATGTVTRPFTGVVTRP